MEMENMSKINKTLEGLGFLKGQVYYKIELILH